MQNQHDAADLTQDTFVKIMLHYADYYYQEPRALLTTIAKSLMSNHYRRKRIEMAYLSTLTEEQKRATIPLEQHILLIETLSELYEIIENMPQRQKQVFILSQLQGLGYDVIARQLDISVSTIKRDLTKAMAICFMAME
ncbi:sigma-70 family RNA polymerase sigma factor [Acinetobacter sp. ANC 3882]|nr:sigma-70 family RNA polymerase sigma factor [Acinetobacter sp. ANC 3882]